MSRAFCRRCWSGPLDGSEDEYEVISGHRRLFAAAKLGMKHVPVMVEFIDRDTAAIEMVDSNLHREKILPSERAFAFKIKMEALKHQGRRMKQMNMDGELDMDTISAVMTEQKAGQKEEPTYEVTAHFNSEIRAGGA